MGAEKVELISTQSNLCHREADSKLCLSNESGAELVEIPKELTNSNTLLFAELSELSQGILDVVWEVLFDIVTGDSGAVPWIIVK